MTFEEKAMLIETTNLPITKACARARLDAPGWYIALTTLPTSTSWTTLGGFCVRGGVRDARGDRGMRHQDAAMTTRTDAPARDRAALDCVTMAQVRRAAYRGGSRPGNLITYGAGQFVRLPGYEPWEIDAIAKKVRARVAAWRLRKDERPT